MTKKKKSASSSSATSTTSAAASPLQTRSYSAAIGATAGGNTNNNSNKKSKVTPTTAHTTTQQKMMMAQQLSNEVARLKNIFLQNGVSFQPENDDLMEEEDNETLVLENDHSMKMKKDVIFPKSEYEYDRSLEPVQEYRGFISKIHNLVVQEHSTLPEGHQQEESIEEEKRESKDEDDNNEMKDKATREQQSTSGFDSGFIALPPPSSLLSTSNNYPHKEGEDDDEEEESDENADNQKKKKQRRMNKNEEQEEQRQDDEAMTATRFTGNWSLGKTQSVRSGLVFLHNEMVAYLAHVSPSLADQQAREEIVNKINQVSKEFWPESTARLFGSCATGLCLPDSDVDISLFNVPREAIHKLSNVFRARNMVEMLQKLDNANVPIVKLRFKGSPFTADISFNQVGGIDTAMFIRKMMENMPEIKPLVLVIKHFLAQRDLNETYRGGMGSYLCFLSVVAVCQRARRLHPDRPSNLGELLLDYLDFYGNVLHYHDVGISLLDGGHFYKKQDRKWLESEKDRGTGSLWLEDPMNPDSNIGAKAYKIQLVRHAFSVVHDALRMKIRDFELSQNSSSSSNSTSTNNFDSSKSILATIIRLKNMNNQSISNSNARRNNIVQFDTESDEDD